jgi:hypothetical protein
MLAELCLGAVLREIQPALEDPIDKAADEGSAVHGRVASATSFRRGAIQVANLPFKQDDRDLRPRLVMHARTAGRRGFHLSAFRAMRVHDRKRLAGLLPAQTHPFAAYDDLGFADGALLGGEGPG